MGKFSIGDTVSYQEELYQINVDEDGDGIYGIMNDHYEDFAFETDLIIIEHGTDRN